MQRFSQLVILEVIGATVSGDHCVAGKSSGKGGARCLQSSRKSYSGTCSTIFVDWELIIKCQISWFRVFFSLSGSLNAVVYSLPPFCVFPGWWCCGKRQRGWLSWIILAKKYHFSEQFVFVVVVEELRHFCFTFWPAVQDHRVVLWWQPVFCIRCVMGSAFISTRFGLLLFHNFWSSLQSLFVLCALKKHSFFSAWEEETI